MPSAPDFETAPDRSPHEGAARAGESAGTRSLRIDPGHAHALLLAAVEHHALPHLLATHGGARSVDTRGSAMSETAPRPRITPGDIENLLVCVSTPDFHLAEAALASIAARGFTRAEVLVDLLTPAARRLHQRWRRDEETFAAVALATGQLQRLLRSAAMPAPEVTRGAPAGRALISGRSDDPRPFEAAVLADFFRGASWDAECVTPRTDRELADRLGEQAFDLLVLAIDPEAETEPEDRLIHRLRAASANPELVILLSGVPSGGLMEQRLQADGAVEHASGAVTAAQKLLFSRVA